MEKKDENMQLTSMQPAHHEDVQIADEQIKPIGSAYCNFVAVITVPLLGVILFILLLLLGHSDGPGRAGDGYLILYLLVPSVPVLMAHFVLWMVGLCFVPSHRSAVRLYFFWGYSPFLLSVLTLAVLFLR